jgi:hypothetical protein
MGSSHRTPVREQSAETRSTARSKEIWEIKKRAKPYPTHP